MAIPVIIGWPIRLTHINGLTSTQFNDIQLAILVKEKKILILIALNILKILACANLIGLLRANGIKPVLCQKEYDTIVIHE